MRRSLVSPVSRVLPLVVALSFAGVATAGPLFPPGAPSPTVKSLNDIDPRSTISSLPFVISSPGVYVLTSDLVCPDGSSGIVVTCPDVTIDLNGYSLRGSAGSLDGIECAVGVSNLVVKNGSISNFGRNGIDSSLCPSTVCVDLHISSCKSSGIVTGGGEVTRCVVENNAEHGVHISPLHSGRCECPVSWTRCVSNGADGLRVSGNGGNQVCGSTSHFRSSSNGGNGIFLDYSSSTARCDFDISSSVCIDNSSSGISLVCNPLSSSPVCMNVSSSRCSGNAGDGCTIFGSSIFALSGCDFSSNTGDGLRVRSSGGGLLCGSTDHFRSSGNGGNGIHVNVSSSTDRCDFDFSSSVCVDNGSSGVRFVSNEQAGENVGLLLRGMRCVGNGVDGFTCVGQSSFTVSSCDFSSNAGHGLHCPAVPGGIAPSSSVSSRVIEGSTLRGNGGSGLATGRRQHSLVVSSSVLSSNSSSGFSVACDQAGGFSSSVSLDRCDVSHNGGRGGDCDDTRAVHVSSSSFRLNGEESLRCVSSSSSGACDVSMDTVSVVCGPDSSGVGFDAISMVCGGDVYVWKVSLHRCDVSGSSADGFSFGSSNPGASSSRATISISSSSFTECDGFGAQIDSAGAIEKIELAVEKVEKARCAAGGLSSHVSNATITELVCVDNGGSGAVLVCTGSSSVSSSSFTDNGGYGLHVLSSGGVIHRDLAARNTLGGLRIDGSGLTVSECVVSSHRNPDNDCDGISVHGSSNRLVGNSSYDNDRGVALYANGNPVYQGSSSETSNPLYEAPGVSGNAPPSSGISSAVNPFTNVLH